MLHPQLGGSADDLVATYDSASPGVLSGMIGQPMKGAWVLNVSDRASRDVGKFHRWTIELESRADRPGRRRRSRSAARRVGGRRRPAYRRIDADEVA